LQQAISDEENFRRKTAKTIEQHAVATRELEKRKEEVR
jgi:hypothetical protein